MKQTSTVFLRIVIFLMGIPIVGLCLFGLPWMAKEAVVGEMAAARYLAPVLTGMYASAIPFFFALFQATRLLHYIDRSTAFSELSVQALKKIKHCAVAITIIYLALMPFLVLMAEADDAPGVPLIGLVIIFASLVIAVFAAVLQKLLKEAIELKSELDLTI
ncbi:MAG: DUF2975 domain-containing protein [Bacillota bacterium]|nr:DUF2975 domain-containing protein [Bacillota bacterium]MDW7678259.1 DUF2975 domain-containing protein [Bacillota bacterium]